MPRPWSQEKQDFEDEYERAEVVSANVREAAVAILKAAHGLQFQGDVRLVFVNRLTGIHAWWVDKLGLGLSPLTGGIADFVLVSDRFIKGREVPDVLPTVEEFRIMRPRSWVPHQMNSAPWEHLSNSWQFTEEETAEYNATRERVKERKNADSQRGNQ